MARPRPIPDLDPAAPARSELGKVLRVRLAETWSWGEHLARPERVGELHAMRIAAKRLRYCLEFFAPWFGEWLTPQLAKLKKLQDFLGAIHDRDVWVDVFRDELRAAFRELRRGRKRLERFTGAADPELAGGAGRLRDALRAGAAQGLLAMIEDLVGERRQLHADCLAFWRALEAEGFRPRLERAIAACAERDPAAPPEPGASRPQGWSGAGRTA